MSKLTQASAPAPTDRPVPAMVADDTTPTCPGGRTWCLGVPGDHSDPREHIHRGPYHSITGSYGRDLLTFNLEQFDDDQPGICFVSDGLWPTLDLPAVDQLITDTAQHLDKLRGARDQLAAIEQGTPAAPAEPRTFTFPLRDGSTLTETCPPGCTTDHQPQTERPQFLSDIWHHIGDEAVLPLTVFDAEDGSVEDRFLAAQVTVSPHGHAARLRVPHVSLDIAQDYSVMEGMTPDELGTVINKLAAHVDQLRGVHAQLVRARADWQANA
ncbi:hypothetical protein [Streptomyces sp. NPDC005970]|uniref:DUF6907 domain-containing protein n=1 Tax=Streptomyces sp. NPDC005970 TaxID=3156723 RepID=UPI0033EBFA3F